MLAIFHRSSQQKMAQENCLGPSSYLHPTVPCCILSSKIVSENKISVNESSSKLKNYPKPSSSCEVKVGYKSILTVSITKLIGLIKIHTIILLGASFDGALDLFHQQIPYLPAVIFTICQQLFHRFNWLLSSQRGCAFR